jgi:hypothetical protein
MSIATEPRRGPGRPPRNGGPPPPPKPETAAQQPPRPQETATQELARLQALRDANSGFLVPKPPGIDSARLILPIDSEGMPVQGTPMLDAAGKAAMAWLAQIAALGGPQDVQLGWEFWRPQAGEMNPKRPTEVRLEQMKAECSKRYAALVARAEEEERPVKALQIARENVRQIEAEFMAESRHLLPIKRRLEQAQAALAALEVTR